MKRTGEGRAWVLRLRLLFRGRQILAGLDPLPGLDDARARHEDAIGIKAEDAMAVWARIVWRILAARPENAWLAEPVGKDSEDPATAADRDSAS